MGLSVYVEGQPDSGVVTGVDIAELAALAETAGRGLIWGCEPFRVTGAEGHARLVVATKVEQDDPEGYDRDVRQCFALALYLSRRRPRWTWRLSDDVGYVANGTEAAAEIYVRDGAAVTSADPDVEADEDGDRFLQDLTADVKLQVMSPRKATSGARAKPRERKAVARAAPMHIVAIDPSTWPAEVRAELPPMRAWPEAPIMLDRAAIWRRMHERAADAPVELDEVAREARALAEARLAHAEPPHSVANAALEVVVAKIVCHARARDVGGVAKLELLVDHWVATGGIEAAAALLLDIARVVDIHGRADRWVTFMWPALCEHMARHLSHASTAERTAAEAIAMSAVAATIRDDLEPNGAIACGAAFWFPERGDADRIVEWDGRIPRLDIPPAATADLHPRDPYRYSDAPAGPRDFVLRKGRMGFFTNYRDHHELLVGRALQRVETFNESGGLKVESYRVQSRWRNASREPLTLALIARFGEGVFPWLARTFVRAGLRADDERRADSADYGEVPWLARALALFQTPQCFEILVERAWDRRITSTIEEAALRAPAIALGPLARAANLSELLPDAARARSHELGVRRADAIPKVAGAVLDAVLAMCRASLGEAIAALPEPQQRFVTDRFRPRRRPRPRSEAPKPLDAVPLQRIVPRDPSTWPDDMRAELPATRAWPGTAPAVDRAALWNALRERCAPLPTAVCGVHANTVASAIGRLTSAAAPIEHASPEVEIAVAKIACRTTDNTHELRAVSPVYLDLLVDHWVATAGAPRTIALLLAMARIAPETADAPFNDNRTWVRHMWPVLCDRMARHLAHASDDDWVAARLEGMRAVEATWRDHAQPLGTIVCGVAYWFPELGDADRIIAWKNRFPRFKPPAHAGAESPRRPYAGVPETSDTFFGNCVSIDDASAFRPLLAMAIQQIETLGGPLWEGGYPLFAFHSTRGLWRQEWRGPLLLTLVARFGQLVLPPMMAELRDASRTRRDETLVQFDEVPVLVGAIALFQLPEAFEALLGRAWDKRIVPTVRTAVLRAPAVALGPLMTAAAAEGPGAKVARALLDEIEASHPELARA